MSRTNAAVHLALTEGGAKLVLRGPLAETVDLQAADGRQFEVDVSHLALNVVWEIVGGCAQARATLLVDQGMVSIARAARKAPAVTPRD